MTQLRLKCPPRPFSILLCQALNVFQLFLKPNRQTSIPFYRRGDSIQRRPLSVQPSCWLSTHITLHIFFFSMKSSLGAGVNFQLAGSWSLPRVMQILASTGSSEPRLLTCTKYSITKLSPGSELHQIQHRWNHVHITPELGYIFPLWIMGNLLIPWITTN